MQDYIKQRYVRPYTLRTFEKEKHEQEQNDEEENTHLGPMQFLDPVPNGLKYFSNSAFVPSSAFSQQYGSYFVASGKMSELRGVKCMFMPTGVPGSMTQS